VLEDDERHQHQGDVANHCLIVQHWQAPSPAYCLLSRKIVSALHLLCLRRTAVVRSAATSLLASQSWLP
jgi:hypothetical protein